MSLHAENVPAIPEETARLAHHLYPKTNRYRLLREELGRVYTDEQFAALYPSTGQSAASPWRLALVLVMQFMENYTDRQAAEAVLSRIDWKYVLGLELSDLGFDFSVRIASFEIVSWQEEWKSSCSPLCWNSADNEVW